MRWVARLLIRIDHRVRSLATRWTPPEPMPPHPLNIPGPFYVEDGCCITCGVWESVAPNLLAWSPGDSPHCYVSRQPETEAEFSQMQAAMEVGEVDCIRVRGCRPDWAARLRAAGLGHQIDPEGAE